MVDIDPNDTKKLQKSLIEEMIKEKMIKDNAHREHILLCE